MSHKIVKDAPRPGTPGWQRIVTASKVPTILGLNPWQTASELWMVMSGLAEPEQLEGDHLEWGHVAERSLCEWWKHKNPGWQLHGREVAYTNTDLPFENIATLDDRAMNRKVGHNKPGRYHILECKTSDSAKTWGDDGELPGHIYAQALAQQGISGIHQGSVIRQLHSTVPAIYDVEWDAELWTGIVDQVHAFVETLGNAEPPMPPADLIDALKAQVQAKPTGEVEMQQEDVTQLLELLERRRELEDDIEQAKEALIKQADGKKITVDGKAFIYPLAGRFSQRNIPDEARHLLMDPEVQKTTLDTDAFKKKYPDIAAAATGDPTYTLKDPYKEK